MRAQESNHSPRIASAVRHFRKLELRASCVGRFLKAPLAVGDAGEQVRPQILGLFHHEPAVT